MMVPLLCYFGGVLTIDNYKPHYEGGTVAPLRVNKSISYVDLLQKLYVLTKYDENRTNIFITCKISTSVGEYISLKIENDDAAATMLDLYPSHTCGVELYIEKEDINMVSTQDNVCVEMFTSMLDENNDSSEFPSPSACVGHAEGYGHTSHYSSIPLSQVSFDFPNTSSLYPYW